MNDARFRALHGIIEANKVKGPNQRSALSTNVSFLIHLSYGPNPKFFEEC